MCAGANAIQHDQWMYLGMQGHIHITKCTLVTI